MTTDLYSAKDKKEVRDILVSEQNSICPITKLKIPTGQEVLDHEHDVECKVRAVLSRQSNSFLGVIENAWKRYLKWGDSESLVFVLRNTADFLEQNKESRWRHDSWIKRVTIDFGQLKESSKDAVLIELGSTGCKNATERKKNFSKALMTRKFSYNAVMDLIKKFK